jgi:hypothetical protein
MVPTHIWQQVSTNIYMTPRNIHPCIGGQFIAKITVGFAVGQNPTARIRQQFGENPTA